jgi:phosphatidylinositol dimannoside acyltransferase
MTATQTVQPADGAAETPVKPAAATKHVRAVHVPRAAGRSRRTIGGWLVAGALRVLSAVLGRLPQRPLHRGAHVIGGVLYRAQPARRQLVRSNLERVVTYLAANDMGGDRVTAAALDPRELDRLVRDAFGHYVRGYLESAALPAYASEKGLARIKPDDPAAAERAFGSAGASIIVGLHFGAIEIPSLWATKKLGRRITAPMETIGNPDLQKYFERSRRATGLNVIPARNSADELRASLARGETVGLVADRPVGGAGTFVELFGAPARLPLGPAALALETGAPAWLVATRRAGRGEYLARIEEIATPAEGSRRDRLSGFMANEARAFERAVADAPEQWWTAFFPIWDDIKYG